MIALARRAIPQAYGSAALHVRTCRSSRIRALRGAAECVGCRRLDALVHLRAFCRSVRYACERRKDACSPHQGRLLAVRPLCAACGVSSPQRCPTGPASQGRRARCAARLRARAHCAPPEAPRPDLLPRRCCVFFGRFAMTVYNVSRFCLNTRFMLLGFSTERFDRV